MRFGVARSVSWLGRFAVDYLVADACHLCRRRHGDGDVLPRHPYQRALAAPTRVELAFGVAVENHPVCTSCAARLEVDGRGRTLGFVLPGGSVLVSGRGVVPAPPVDDASAPVPGSIRAFAPFRTDATLLRVIHLVKFTHLTSLLPSLAEATALRLRAEVSALPSPVLVPVPMDRRAERRRGFNQSARIAALVSRRLGVPMAEDAVVKVRPTRPQSLTASDRRFSNVRGAFARGPAPVAGRDAVVVDDLVTTGATTAAVAAVLAASGAASVCVASVATALQVSA